MENVDVTTQTEMKMVRRESMNEIQIKLTPFAKVFYLESALEPDGCKYNMLCADQILYGNLDVGRLQSALIRYVADHFVLNSHIELVNAEPCWVKNTQIRKVDYCTDAVSESELLEYVRNPFDVYGGPLYRFRLIRISENVHRFMVVMHHLVMDGVSLNTGIIDAISNYYNRNDYCAETSVETQIDLLTNLERQLSDELERNSSEYQNFWRQKLTDLEAVNLRFLETPTIKTAEPEVASCNPITEVKFTFDRSVTEKLRLLSKRYRVTPFLYSQTIYAILLHKYTGQRQFAIGYPIAIKEGAHFIYGSQVNVNLIPYQFESGLTPGKIFQRTRDFFIKTLKSSVRYGYCPTYDILQATCDNKKIMQVFFAQAPFRSKPFQFNGIEKTESLVQTLNVDGAEKGVPIFDQEASTTHLNFRFRYHRDSINNELLVPFLESYKQLFNEILDDQLSDDNCKTIADYSLMSREYYWKMVNGFNQEFNHQPEIATIHGKFEEQVQKTPNNVAVVFGTRKVTYQELNERSNQLARYIQRNYPIEPGQFIALYLHKTEQTVTAILAVLKCGAAYVPISVDYPIDRVEFILKDTCPKVTITNNEYEPKLIEHMGQMSLIKINHIQLEKQIAKEKKENLSLGFSNTNLAYVIYTSGTTGQPKGVLQQHNNVCNFLDASNPLYQFDDKDVWLLFHSYVFDFTVWEMWGALFYGGKLIVPNCQQLRDFDELYQLCLDTGITVLNLTTSVFYQFSEVVLKTHNQHLHRLRYMIFGGEKLSATALIPWFSSRYKDYPKLVTVYGITELTVLSTCAVIDSKTLSSYANIGKVLPHQTSYILDENLSVLPVGAIGELYVGGESLARGYLNDAQLTEKRFITNPFQTEVERAAGRNGRLYKTGDLVRRMPDGSLEYIGRNDRQFKLRGFRLEAEEIETLLCAYPGIKQAAVLLIGNQTPLEAESQQSNNTINLPESESTGNEEANSGNFFKKSPNTSDLLPIQEWFFAQEFKNIHHWNQSFLVRTPQLNFHLLESSVKQLVTLHECFYSRFSFESGVTRHNSVKRTSQNVKLHRLDIRSLACAEGTKEFNETLYEIFTGWQSEFNITNGPLYALGYVYGFNDSSARVYFALHHLIVDVVSCHILVHDLKEIYTARLKAHENHTIQSGDPAVLSQHSNSYRQWIIAVHKYAECNQHEKAYWFGVLAGHDQFDALLEKFTSHEAGDSAKINLTLNKDDTEQLLKSNRVSSGYKIDEILIAVLAISVRSFLSKAEPSINLRSIYLTLEGHGRKEIDANIDITRTVGWFTTMYPCQLSIDDSNPEEILKTVRRSVDEVPAHGLGYGALLGNSRKLPRVGFNYLGWIGRTDDQTDWFITNEPSGRHTPEENKNTNVVDLLGSVVDGQLELTLQIQLAQPFFNWFVDLFTSQLNAMVSLAKKHHSDAGKKTCNLVLPKQRYCTWNQNHLAAYYVCDRPLVQADIKAYLSKQLPQYAVPQQLFMIEKMPLTINGKVDTKALSKLVPEIDRGSVEPGNEKEKLICDIFAKVLNRKKIGIYDDFFVHGGDSLSAITLTIQLQNHFDVHVRDIFGHRTPHQLALNLPFSNYSIKCKLIEIARQYENQPDTGVCEVQTINRNLSNYLSSSATQSVDVSKKELNHVLLTGATGFLGCNLLNQLLIHTEYRVVLLVRADSDQAALDRVVHKYRFYFPNLSLQDHLLTARVSIFCADLEKKYLGLSRRDYAKLVGTIDSVIHSAALVKQIGDADVFFRANELTTINLLDFSKLTKSKDFHYISTASVLNSTPDAMTQWGNYYTEELLPKDLQPIENNVYLKSKLEAENKVIGYRAHGLNANIYRVGNLAFMSESGAVQENADTLAFTHWLKYFFTSKSVILNTKIYISTVDQAADAVVKLFDKRCATNRIFHIFNTHPFDLVGYMQNEGALQIEVLSLPQFIQHVMREMDSETSMEPTLRFLLAQGWLGVDGIYQFTQKGYLQDRTQSILKQLGFEWLAITSDQFKKYLDHIFKAL